MHFYANDPDCAVLTAMLAAQGHTLRTIDPDGACAKAALAAGGNIIPRVPTLWEPAHDLAARYGGSGPRAAAEAIAVLGDNGVTPVDMILGKTLMDYGIVRYRPDQMGEVLGYADHADY